MVSRNKLNIESSWDRFFIDFGDGVEGAGSNKTLAYLCPKALQSFQLKIAFKNQVNPFSAPLRKDEEDDSQIVFD